MSINAYIEKNDMTSALEECLNTKQYFLGLFLGRITNCKNYTLMSQLEDKSKDEKEEKEIRIKLLCSWCSSLELCNNWNKMSKGNYTWDNIKIVFEDPVDYYIVINSTNENIIKKRTILFRMEPDMENNKWGEWSNPKDDDFMLVLRHESGHYNNIEWHLSKTWQELNIQPIIKDTNLNNILSTVLSEKYHDTGHIRRVDFVKFLEGKNFPVHVFGNNKWNYIDYKGELPKYCKDNAILPYKYTFNVENNEINNYFTEKLIDGILGECLVFYSGCYNVRNYIDERAYVYLHLRNFEQDYETIKKAIEEDWHTKRLPYIKEMKKKILNKLQFFPRIKKIIDIDLRRG